MALTVDIGERFELVPMDPHCGNISIALYRQLRETSSEFLVHSYSRREGAREREEFVARAMRKLGGMELNSQDLLRLWFPCHAEHKMAVRRIFLEACKLDSSDKLEPRPLAIWDKNPVGLSLSRALAAECISSWQMGKRKARRAALRPWQQVS